jgi:hypothetical protein
MVQRRVPGATHHDVECLVRQRHVSRITALEVGVADARILVLSNDRR